MRLDLLWNTAGVAFALMAVTACAPSVPRYQWTNDQAALDELAHRAAMVKTVQSACSITLRDENNQQITLDGALVARQPGHLRIRAWKFEHAVFDVTATPDGVWIDAPDDDKRFEHTALGKNITEAWTLFSGEFVKRALVIDHSKKVATEITFIEQSPASPGSIISCVVSKSTLTPKRYEVRASDGSLLYAIRMENHRQVAGIIWPRKVIFERGTNAMSINLHDVEFNGELNPNAFTPPSGAVRPP